MMIVTKKGFRLWWSGMQATIMMSVLGLLFADVSEEWPLALAAIVWLMLFPMAIGWVQRRYWTGS